MKTQLVLFSAGCIGVLSTALAEASMWLTERQRRIVRNYFGHDFGHEKPAPRAERAN